MRSWLAVLSVLLLAVLACSVSPTATAPPGATVAPALAVSESVWGEVPRQCA